MIVTGKRAGSKRTPPTTHALDVVTGREPETDSEKTGSIEN